MPTLFLHKKDLIRQNVLFFVEIQQIWEGES